MTLILKLNLDNDMQHTSNLKSTLIHQLTHAEISTLVSSAFLLLRDTSLSRFKVSALEIGKKDAGKAVLNLMMSFLPSCHVQRQQCLTLTHVCQASSGKPRLLLATQFGLFCFTS